MRAPAPHHPSAERLATELGHEQRGEEVLVSPGNAEVTPTEGGVLLGMSRPQVRKLMDRGLLDFRKVGSHHRIRVSSIRAFLESKRPRRREALADLAALQDELGLCSRLRLRGRPAACARHEPGFPFAEVEPGDEHWRMLDDALAGVPLPDEGDRHVLAAALAAEATVLCTANIKDFPAGAMRILGVEVQTPDQLLAHLITEYPPEMLSAHRAAVASLKGATDQSTIEALGRAGTTASAELMRHLLGFED